MAYVSLPGKWFAKLNLALRKYSLQHSYVDHTLCTFQKGDDILSFLIYADYILAGGEMPLSAHHFSGIWILAEDLGPLKYSLV